MKLLLELSPEWTRDQYNVDKHACKRFVYWEIPKASYLSMVFPKQVCTLANEQTRENLKPRGYCEVQHAPAPGLWRHRRRPILFWLIVDNFGIRYVAKKHAIQLHTCLKKHYDKVTTGWKDGLYAGIYMDWNYEKMGQGQNERICDKAETNI